MPFSKWLITMVSRSLSRVIPLPNGLWLINGGYQPLTNWDDPPSNKYVLHLNSYLSTSDLEKLLHDPEHLNSLTGQPTFPPNVPPPLEIKAFFCGKPIS